MIKKTKNTCRGRGRDVETTKGDAKMTIADATLSWNKKFPETPVTPQTIRNWARKYDFGKKCSFLPRSRWQINEKAFNEFLNDPGKFLNSGTGANKGR